MQTPERQASIIKQMDAIGALSSYFYMVAFNAQTAAKGIEAGEIERDELLAGEGA